MEIIIEFYHSDKCTSQFSTMLRTASLLIILVAGAIEGSCCGDVLEFYPKGSRFEFRTRYRIPWLRFLAGFLGVFSQIPSEIVNLFCFCCSYRSSSAKAPAISWFRGEGNWNNILCWNYFLFIKANFGENIYVIFRHDTQQNRSVNSTSKIVITVSVQSPLFFFFFSNRVRRFPDNFCSSLFNFTREKGNNRN